MSGSRARAARRVAGPKAERADVLEILIAPAVCLNTDEAIAETRKVTHDGVIAGAGAARRSGVTWYVWRGELAVAKWDAYVATSRSTGDPLVDQQQALYRDYLLEHGDDGVLVLAAVDVAKPRAFVGPS